MSPKVSSGNDNPDYRFIPRDCQVTPPGIRDLSWGAMDDWISMGVDLKRPVSGFSLSWVLKFAQTID
jgi:hypothetical protein